MIEPSLLAKQIMQRHADLVRRRTELESDEAALRKEIEDFVRPPWLESRQPIHVTVERLNG